MRLLVIIPAYNEEENIQRVIEELEQYDYDYVVVNDRLEDCVSEILNIIDQYTDEE